jgi:hypothetical protein
MILGKLSPSDLSDLLALLPHFESIYEEVRGLFARHPEKMTPKGFVPPAWYGFYEMPIQEHIAHIIELTDLGDEMKPLLTANDPHHALIQNMKDSLNESEESQEKFDENDRPLVALGTGFAVSIYLSIKSLMTFGLYINELVALAGEENPKSDKALFQAVKIDPTVIGCSRIISRISLAILRNDQKFLKALQQSMSGKLTKREQKTYQLQRLVLQILNETGAPKLTQDNLYELFVNQLKIVARDRDSDIGDVANNLRQFSYQFMKQKSVSKNA